MSTGQIRFCFMAFALVSLVPCSAARCEPPKFNLQFPTGEDCYFNTSSIAFGGKVDPPIRTDVRIQLYHVLENGELLPEGGVSRSLDATGQFSLTLEPRAGGWTPGMLRCVVTAGSHLLRRTVDIEMIDSGAKPTPIRVPKDSGIVVDFSDLRDDTPRVPAGQKFRIRGLFVYGVPPNQHQGPSVRIELLAPNPMQPRPIIAQSDHTLSFPVDEFNCEFESEIVAPERPGDYDVHVAIPIHDAAGERMEKHYDTVLTIGPPKEEPKK